MGPVQAADVWRSISPSGDALTALPSRMYKDPLEILIEQESRTCKGCANRVFVWGREGCLKGRKPMRCKHYKEGKPDDGN